MHVLIVQADHRAATSNMPLNYIRTTVELKRLHDTVYAVQAPKNVPCSTSFLSSIIQCTDTTARTVPAIVAACQDQGRPE